MKKTNYKVAVLEYLLIPTATPTRPSGNLWLGLLETEMDDDSDGVEASYVGYARQEVTFSAAEEDSDNFWTCKNSAEITFPIIPATGGSLTGFALYTASTAGEAVYYGGLGASYSMVIGLQPVVPTNNLEVKES
jgi:hypothetical protein